MATVRSSSAPAREGDLLPKSRGLEPYGKGGIAPWRKPPWQGAVDLDHLVRVGLLCRGDKATTTTGIRRRMTRERGDRLTPRHFVGREDARGFREQSLTTRVQGMNRFGGVRALKSERSPARQHGGGEISVQYVQH